jgi:hypothetical protein
MLINIKCVNCHTTTLIVDGRKLKINAPIIQGTNHTLIQQYSSRSSKEEQHADDKQTLKVHDYEFLFSSS